MAAELDYRHVLDSFSDAVVASDERNVITYVNAAAETLLGWPRAELLGRPLGTIMPARMRAGHDAGFERFVRTRESRIVGKAIRVPALHKDGRELDIELTLSTHTTEERILIVASLRDLRERIELERQLATQRQHLAGYEVMSALTESRTFEQAAPKVLGAIADALGWDVGVFWKGDAGNGVLRAEAFWTSAAAQAASFIEETKQVSFRPGEGLPGQAWQTRQTLWSLDVANDPRYLRREAAAASGLQGVFLFPVFCANEPHGLLEFLSRHPKAPDPDLLQIMATIGFQIGQFLERVRTEKALIIANESLVQERNNLVLLANAIPQLVWSRETDGRFGFFNARWYEYTGNAPGDGQQDAWERVTHPDDWEVMNQRWARCLAEGVPFEGEVRLCRASDGGYRWHLARALPMKDGTGRIIKWVGTATDIDDQKRNEELSRFMAEASTLLSASLDYETTLRNLAALVVPRFADWCAVHLQKDGVAVPQQLAVAHRDPDKATWAAELNKRYPPNPASPIGAAAVIRTGKAQLVPELTDQMLVAAAKDEEHLKILREVGMSSAMIVPLKLRGRTFGTLSFVAAESRQRYTQVDLDIAQQLADRAAMAVENAGLYNDAQRAVQVRDDFLSVASHELKTPMTPLQLHLQSLMRDTRPGTQDEVSPKIAIKLTTIGRQVSRMERLIDSLLDISRITGNRLDVEREQVDLSELVREVGARFEEERANVQTALIVHAPRPVVGHWDRLRLDQILSNLLQNALKFGAGKPVEISVERLNGHARLVIRDYGIGIAPEDQARIFERFERAVSTRHYGGFGLGLWIARQIVERLGGTIHVQSKVDEGSTFTVLLPVENPDQDDVFAQRPTH